MPQTISPSQISGADISAVPRNNGIQTSITINNDNFADAQDFLINKTNIQTLAFQIQNTGDTNGLSFEIYGTIDPGSSAPAFNLMDWELLSTGSGDIANTFNKIFDTLFYLTFVLIRLKRQTAGNSTTAKILSTSGGR